MSSFHCALKTTLLAATLSATGCGGTTGVDAPDDAPRVTIVAGNNQVGIPGRALVDSLVAKFVDASGNPMPGATLTWAASNGTLSTTSATTDASGLARARWSIGAGSGTVAVTAAGVQPASFVGVGRPPGACELTPSPQTQRFSLGPTDYSLSLRATVPQRVIVLFVDFPATAATETTGDS